MTLRFVPSDQSDEVAPYSETIKAAFKEVAIRDGRNIGFRGASWDFDRLGFDLFQAGQVIHYPIPYSDGFRRHIPSRLSVQEVDILNQRGAFLLPQRVIRDSLVKTYFTWIAPLLPIIDKNEFWHKYYDPRNTLSILLLQAILAAAARISNDPKLKEDDGSTRRVTMVFYKRAKALFDAEYETDRITIVQAATILGWCWENPTSKPACSVSPKI